jgi:hypothetical protein
LVQTASKSCDQRVNGNRKANIEEAEF